MSLLPPHKPRWAHVLDELVGERLDTLDISGIDTRAATCKEQVLVSLARGFGLSHDDPSVLRRLLVRPFSSLLGTKKHLVEQLTSCFENLEFSVQEWYEYSGEPYHFKVVIITPNDNPINMKDYNFEELVSRQKNVRSVFDKFEFVNSIDVIAKTITSQNNTIIQDI